MLRTRLIFEKTGRAQYISHLDLMRTFQRVFLRAGVKLRHSEGFNPHPYLSFALPLSVGIESLCELADFDLTDDMALDCLPALLNEKMPEGLHARGAYRPETKFTGIARVSVEGRFVYDAGFAEETPDKLTALFCEKELVVSKKTKKGPADFDLIPFLYEISFKAESATDIAVNAVISAQNPTINPESIVQAIRSHRSAFTPDFASFRRLEVLDADNRIFR